MVFQLSRRQKRSASRVHFTPIIRNESALKDLELDSGRCIATAIVAGGDPAWDALVEGTPGGDLAQTTLWAASRRQLGFRCHRIAVTLSDQKLIGGCMLYSKRVAPGVWLGSIPRGPLVFVDSPYAPSTTVREVTAFARRHGITLLVIQPPGGGSNIEAALVSAGFRLGVHSIAPEATLSLDLRLKDEELLAAMSSKRRQIIRKALRAQFEVREEQDIELFHHLHTLTAKRQGFVPVELRNLRAQWETLAPSGNCIVLIARYGGSPIAGLWLTRFAGTLTEKLAGWDAASAPANANEALHWAAIQWARRSGAHTYDWGGFDRRSAEMMIGNMPLGDGFQQTPSYFKLSFGGSLILLPRARFKFTNRLVDTAIGPVAHRVLTSPMARKLASRFRNGSRLTGPIEVPLGGKMSLVFSTMIKPIYLHARYLGSLWADHRLGITTTDQRLAQGFKCDVAEYCSRHRAIPYLAAKRVMRRLDFGPHDVLLDFGCGAGRLICVAAQYPFSRIIGVDVDADLCAVAKRNVEALGRCRTLPEVVCADAATYGVPDEVTVVFLFNPFPGSIVQAVLTRVLEFFDRAPRRMRVVYANPREHDLVMSMRHFRDAGRFWISWRPGKEWRLTQAVQFYEIDRASFETRPPPL